MQKTAFKLSIIKKTSIDSKKEINEAAGQKFVEIRPFYRREENS